MPDPAKGKKPGRWKRYLPFAIVLIGILVICYPFIAFRYNARHQSLVAAEYHQQIQQKDDRDLQTDLEAAKQYNAGLQDGSVDGLDPANSGYQDTLSTPDGAMAVLRVPSIDVELPIYHGVDNYAMSVGAGHMPNTSLPIGGKGTHCCVSSHSGLADYRGFTDLPDIQMGAMIYVDVLDQTLTYKVTSIKTVLPYETDALLPVADQDLFSLITCVPVFVNSHRLIVTGTRVEDAAPDLTEPEVTEPAPTESQPTEPEQSGQEIFHALRFLPLILLILLLIAAAVLYFVLKKKK